MMIFAFVLEQHILLDFYSASSQEPKQQSACRHHVALLGRHVALLGRHVALLGHHVALLGRHVALLGRHVALLGRIILI